MASRRAERTTKRNWAGRRVKYAVTEGILARKMALYYLTLLRAKSLHARPWRTAVRLEDQAVFSHFVLTARLVRDEGLDYRTFLKAQFEEWRPWGRLTYPQPSHLHSEGSLGRYSQYTVERDGEKQEYGTDESVDAREKSGKDPFEYDRRKLKRLKVAHGRPGKVILCRFPCEFSRGFLKDQGVWPEVKKVWLAARSDT